MRVIAGRLGGRRLRPPPEAGVRPTSDRVREALFARLGALEGAHVLDLYAGTGALGIEALSRGAAAAIFVERAAASLTVLIANIANLDLEREARVLRGDALATIRRLGRSGARFDLVLADPPYASDDAGPVLAALRDAQIVSEQGTVVLETSRRHPVPAVPGWRVASERRYGDTLVTELLPDRAVGSGGPLEPRSQERNEKRKHDRGGRRHDARMTKTRQHGLALFPASFDPVTNGHLDIIHRAAAVFEELVVAVATNVEKSGLFTVPERVEMLHAALDGRGGIRITSFEGLLVDYARQIGARVLLRGLRAMSDFEYEFEMALMNRHLYPEIETLFMMTSQQFFYVSSSRLKELVRFGGNVDDFVPAGVALRLREKLARR